MGQLCFRSIRVECSVLVQCGKPLHVNCCGQHPFTQDKDSIPHFQLLDIVQLYLSHLHFLSLALWQNLVSWFHKQVKQMRGLTSIVLQTYVGWDLSGKNIYWKKGERFSKPLRLQEHACMHWKKSYLSQGLGFFCFYFKDHHCHDWQAGQMSIYWLPGKLGDEDKTSRWP